MHNIVSNMPQPLPLPCVSLTELAAHLEENLPLQTRDYRMRSYEKTFLGVEAVTLIDTFLKPYRRHGVHERRHAEIVGRELARRFHLFEHVAKEHALVDDYYIYRLSTERRIVETSDIENSQFFDQLYSGEFNLELDDDIASLDMIMESIGSHSWLPNKLRPRTFDLRQASIVLEDGIKKRNCYVSGTLYRNCFVGSDAVDLLVGSGIASSRQHAEEIGQTLADQYNLFKHCTGDCVFEDNHYFYQFTEVRDRWRAVKSSSDNVVLQQVAEDFKKSVNVQDHSYRLRNYPKSFSGNDAVNFLVDRHYASDRFEAVELGRRLATDLNLFRHSGAEPCGFRDDNSSFYTFDETPTEEKTPHKDVAENLKWKAQMQKFQSTFASRQSGHSHPNRSLMWASTFRKLDPRYRILDHFREASQLDIARHDRSEEGTRRHPLFRFFPQSNIFTVWRPTSYESIRKMMLGQAVGKGLDIKGKSSKRGKLSGYVPFLQIGDNRHKRLVRELDKTGHVRVFFSHSLESVVKRFHNVALDMQERVEMARKVLSSTSSDASSKLQAEQVLREMDMNDYSVRNILDYAPSVYGLEMPIRLFWEVFVVRQDISRKPGSIYDTGRPSIPPNQDLNILALLAKPKPNAPRAVVYQHSAQDDPFNPQELLMAYEECGRVLPVASDFDAFLVGTKRMRFEPKELGLAQEQVNVLDWSITQIGTILDSPPRPGSWTKRWWENLEREVQRGTCPKAEIPQYGFGDPLSYKMIENAVQGLSIDGSVRHGAESFNYKYPQELDDEFLVISEELHPVPWRYMSVQDLQKFLSERIDDGFAFPLNPKWILCDQGWKVLYSKLQQSRREDVQKAMNTWFPASISRKIAEISKAHPNGFEGRALRSQEDVQKRFIPLLRRENKVFRKRLPAYARQAKKGELIFTTINGRAETENTVLDDTSWVVRGKASGEYYVLADEDFKASYEETGQDIQVADSNHDLTRLQRQGFKEYRSKKQVWARKVTREDMTFFQYGEEARGPIAYFVAPWREYMRVEEGDILVMHYPHGNEEIYRIEHFVFKESYEPLLPNIRISTKNIGESVAMLSSNSVQHGSRLVGRDGQRLRSQEEVIARFVPMLKSNGKVYRKVVGAHIRRGYKGEKIATVIDGKLETENTIKDDSSWVVHGETAGELYCLTNEQFEKNYDTKSAESISYGGTCSPELSKRLEYEGFRKYRSKRRVWAIVVDKDDLAWFNFSDPTVEFNGKESTSYFVAPWGEYTVVEGGDYIATGYPDSDDGVYRIEQYAFNVSYKPVHPNVHL